MQAAFLGLIQCDIHDLLGNALDLDVHLQRSHTVLRAGNLEIHVPQVILVTEDIRQYGESVAFLDKPHGDAGDMRVQRHAGIHQCKATTAYGSHRTRAVGFGDFRDDPHGIGELFGFWQHGQQRALGETTMPDFATFRCAYAAGLTGRIRREIVVEHEAFGVFAHQRVDDLLIACRAQGGNSQCLGFTARK